MDKNGAQEGVSADLIIVIFFSTNLICDICDKYELRCFQVESWLVVMMFQTFNSAKTSSILWLLTMFNTLMMLILKSDDGEEDPDDDIESGEEKCKI